MKLSERLNLNKSQRELDFIDIDLLGDMPLFIDPYFLSIRETNWCKKANNTLHDFFECIVNLVRAGKIDEAKELFDYLHEPNETNLGLSSGLPKGKGVGKNDTDRMFKRIIKSKAIQTGLVQHLEDTTIFVDRIGKDKLSDMATNIIRKHLIDYTQSQCYLLDIPLTENLPTGYYWDTSRELWVNEFDKMLFIDGKVVLLVPKIIVSYNSSYTPQKYYQHFILYFLQQEHLRLNSALVETRRTKKGKITKKVTKKALKNSVAPYDKDFIRAFTLKNMGVYEEFKKDVAKQGKPIDVKDLENFNFKEFSNFLAKKLKELPKGKKHADDYHVLIIGILNFLFYPQLTNPQKEYKTHNGRKRIDIIFDNAAEGGFFRQLHEISNIPCVYIIIECKNYTDDPVNPELDQLSGRFSPNKGKFGILMCREIKDERLFNQRCTDTFQEDRGLIIGLTDSDLISVLESFNSTGENNLEAVLTEKKRKVTFG
jgi:hypothetical protein